MLKILGDNEHDGMIRIKDIILPCPKPEDAWLWKMEFMDLLAQYTFLAEKHIDRISSFESYFDEGPYELNENIKVTDGDVVFDLGANMGMFSAVASARGAKKVYSFEPSYKIRENYLRYTEQYNNNIEICPYAVADYVGETKFEVDNSNIGASRLINGEGESDKEKYEIVKVITLDQFVKERDIKKVDFIKADIEGAERDMLRGATEILRRFKPKLSICTYHLPDDPKVLKNIILRANPDYTIIEKYKKLYAF